MPLDTPILFAATTNAARSRKFYENMLGLRFVADEMFALVFKVGELDLRIQKVEQRSEIGYTVLGWAVRDIRQSVRQLVKAGVVFARFEGLEHDDDAVWTAPGGAKIAWFRDPDGNTLSITEYALPA